jgi:hypothetical protein
MKFGDTGDPPRHLQPHLREKPYSLAEHPGLQHKRPLSDFHRQYSSPPWLVLSHPRIKTLFRSSFLQGFLGGRSQHKPRREESRPPLRYKASVGMTISVDVSTTPAYRWDDWRNTALAYRLCSPIILGTGWWGGSLQRSWGDGSQTGEDREDGGIRQKRRRVAARRGGATDSGINPRNQGCRESTESEISGDTKA